MTRMPPVAARSAAIAVEARGSLELAPQDVEALDRLIAMRPEAGVFVSKAWLSGYFAEPPAGAEPVLLLFRDGPALCAIVPLALRRTATHLRIGLLGGGAGSDRVDLLARPGYEASCSEALLAWAQSACGHGGFVFELRDVPAESPIWGALHRASSDGTQPLAFTGHEVHTHLYLDLRGTPDPVEPLEKHRRWLAKRGEVRCELLENEDEVLDAFDHLERFLHVRWNGQGGSALDDPRPSRFHRRVLPLLLREGRLRMLRLSVSGRIVAVFYGLGSGGWWGYYLAGYDREWAGRIHLGRILLNAAIEQAVRQGSATFDFLKGADAMKYAWRVRERATLDGDAWSPHGGAQLDRAARAARELAAACAKALRHFTSR